MTLTIPPVIHTIAHFNEMSRAEWIGAASAVAVFLFAAALVALIVGRFAAGKYGGGKSKTALLFIGVTLFMSAILLCFFGSSAITVKGIIISVLLSFASYGDVKERECENYVHVMIVIAAFIGTNLSSLPNMILSGLFTGGIMLITLLFTKSKIGGADIKMAVACSFLLGVSRGLIGLLVGMTVAVIFNLFRKNKTEGFPLIPYLAVGYMTAFFIPV